MKFRGMQKRLSLGAAEPITNRTSTTNRKPLPFPVRLRSGIIMLGLDPRIC
jgi:hypothetical protein